MELDLYLVSFRNVILNYNKNTCYKYKQKGKYNRYISTLYLERKKISPLNFKFDPNVPNDGMIFPYFPRSDKNSEFKTHV